MGIAIHLIFLALGTDVSRFGDPSLIPPPVQSVLSGWSADTSHIEWSVTWVGGYNDGLVERYLTRTTEDETWETNYGDENGNHQKSFRAIPPPGTALSAEELEQYIMPDQEVAGTRHRMTKDGRSWELYKEELPLSAAVIESSDPRNHHLPVNLHSIGLSPGWMTESVQNPLLLQEGQLEGYEGARFTSSSGGRETTVAADYGRQRLEWVFDSEQGNMPVQALFYQNDVLSSHSQTSYECVDGRWVPKGTRFYQGDGDSPYKVVEVRGASFNKEWHQKDIGPDDMGLAVGTTVYHEKGASIWDGLELVDVQSYGDRISLYGMNSDPRIVKHLADSVKMSVQDYLNYVDKSGEKFRQEYFKKTGEQPWLWEVPKKSKDKDEWDVYVEKFIADHKLEKKAAGRANELLDRAKKMRDAHYREKRNEYREAERDKNEKKIEALDRYPKKIFDKFLVKSLNRLLPKEDRKKEDAKPD